MTYFIFNRRSIIYDLLAIALGSLMILSLSKPWDRDLISEYLSSHYSTIIASTCLVALIINYVRGVASIKQLLFPRLTEIQMTLGLLSQLLLLPLLFWGSSVGLLMLRRNGFQYSIRLGLLLLVARLIVFIIASFLAVLIFFDTPVSVVVMSSVLIICVYHYWIEATYLLYRYFLSHP